MKLLKLLPALILSASIGAAAGAHQPGEPGATMKMFGSITDVPYAFGTADVAFNFFEPDSRELAYRTIVRVAHASGEYVAEVPIGNLPPGSYAVNAQPPHAPPQFPDAAPSSYVRLQAATPGTQQAGNVNISGKVIAGQFEGNGSLLTGLNASSITLGTLADARIPANVARTNAAQTWVATQAFAIPPSFTSGGLPFTVSSTAHVANLNVDLLDGFDSTSFLRGIPTPLTLVGDQPGGHIVKASNSSLVDGSSGLFGESTATPSGATYGVRGLSTASQGGAGVYGQATANLGVTYGLYGRASSSSGRGVFGEASSGIGFTFGLMGQSASSDGRGVFGRATATLGNTYGGLFQSDSSSGTGVRGHAFASTGATVGVSGLSASTSGRGVFGWATGTTGTNFGVYAQSDSPAGYAFYATGAGGGSFLTLPASNDNSALIALTAGLGRAGHFIIENPNNALQAVDAVSAGTGWAVKGLMTGTGVAADFRISNAKSTNHALLAETTGSGEGLWGVSATGNGIIGRSGGLDRAGVRGEGTALSGYGVAGYATASTGINYGVRGETSSPDGYGVYSKGNLHVEGNLTASGSKTGFVADIVLNGGTEPLEPGDLVEIIGHEKPVLGRIPVIVVRKTTSAESLAVLGPVAYAASITPSLSADASTASAHVVEVAGSIQPGAYGTVVTLGAFERIKVDASFGPIRPGDLLVSSPNPGYAMAVAKAETGTVIGKALASLDSGVGEIPVLVSPR